MKYFGTIEQMNLISAPGVLLGIALFLAIVCFNGYIVRRMSPGAASPVSLGAIFFLKVLAAGVLMYTILSTGVAAPSLALGFTIGLVVVALRTIISFRMESNG